MDNTRKFIESEMLKRGWKQADLARASHLSTAVISNIINGKRNIGETTARAIAHAFQLPEENVFREVGLLPKVPENISNSTELQYLLSTMDSDDIEEVLRFVRFRMQEKKNIKKASRGKSPARSIIEQ